MSLFRKRNISSSMLFLPGLPGADSTDGSMPVEIGRCLRYFFFFDGSPERGSESREFIIQL